MTDPDARDDREHSGPESESPSADVPSRDAASPEDHLREPQGPEDVSADETSAADEPSEDQTLASDEGSEVPQPGGESPAPEGTPAQPPVPAPNLPPAPPPYVAPPPVADPYQYGSADQGTYGSPVPMRQPAPTGPNGLAVAGLATGAAGLFLLGPILGAAAIVLGIMGLRHARSRPDRKGETMAKWAIGLGIVDIVLPVIVVSLIL